MKWLQAIFLLSFFSASSFAGGLFSIVGPRTVQFGNDYTFFLAATDYDDGEIEISLNGHLRGEEIFNENYELGYLNRNITIPLSAHTTVENLTLTAKIASEGFSQSVDIFMIAKRYSVFIQTDKPIYKPGDIVKFRVLVIDAEMKPYRLDSLKVELIDAQENVVGDYDGEDDENFERGVIANEFQIATEPYSGNWRIRVRTIDEKSEDAVITEKSFEIKEYVLPRFEVGIENKHDVQQNEGSVRLTIYGNYTFGEFVKGKAKITAKTFDTNYLDLVQNTVTKTVDVECRKMVLFDIKNELKVVNTIRPYLIKFEVEFEEGLTGQIMVEKTEVRIHKTGETKLKIVPEMKTFKPGFQFKLKVIAKTFDGSPVSDIHTPMKLKVNYFYKAPLCSFKSNVTHKTFEHHEQQFLKKGVAEFTLNVTESTTAMQITATFNEMSENINIPRQDSRSREYLVINSLTKTPKINQKVKIEIQGNGDWGNTKFYAVVIGRTGILTNEVFEYYPIQNNRKSKASKNKNNKDNDENQKQIMYYEFKANDFMAPTAHIIIYYMQFYGEIVYDKIVMEFDRKLPNDLELKLSSNIVKPKSQLSITCKTADNSFISLLGVDKSVTLLGSGNDIDKSRIAQESSVFDINQNYPELKIKGNIENRYSDFGESNAIILTNALDGQKTCSIDERLTAAEIADISGNDDDDSGLDFGDDDKPESEKFVRKNFPETWIFDHFEADDDGKYKFDTPQVPDTITSFIVTGFAVHEKKGLAISKPTTVTVFQDFFLKLYLPYSVRLGEILKVEVTVFNYIERPRRSVDANVELFKDDGFDFIDTQNVGGECVKTASKDSKRSKTITIPTGNGASTFFLIKTLVTGEIKLRVRAKTSGRSDSVEKILLVEHEGLSISGNIAKFYKAGDGGFNAESFNIPFIVDSRIIPDSIVIEAAVIGDRLGPALQNIHNLIRLPSGCSEQQFKSFIPNIAAIRYLKAINKLTDQYLKDGERFLSTGYQQLLGRRKSDGSYSLWGESGDSSIWLTAYVSKILTHTKEFISVNDKYISEALKYVSQRQQPGGSFPQHVRDYYYIKSKSQEGVPLTAFCTIAFLENKDYRAEYKTLIDNALSYIDSKVTTLQDNFAFAIAAYALSLNKHPATNNFLQQLIDNAIKHDDTLMYWFREGKALKSNDSPSINVEIAAYALMAFVEMDRTAEAIPIMNWLMTQRNAAGGFHSTTDTVIGIQALTKIAAVLHTPRINLEVKLTSDRNQHIFKINEKNALELQVREFEKSTRQINVNLGGEGNAYVQVSYRYNTILDDVREQFELTAVPTISGSMLTLKICAKFIDDGDIHQSAMTLVEAYLPSGYVYDPKTAELVKSVGVRRIETEKQKTIIILYFDNMTNTTTCFNVQAIRQNVVTELKDSVVKIYDYNNKNYRASAFYSLKGEKFC